MDAFDRMIMLEMSNRGNKLANLFLEKEAKYPSRNAEEVTWNRPSGSRLFNSPKAGEFILMFEDSSGVYIAKDGFCTPMGNIQDEVSRYNECTSN
jgi:hypothetical protein